MCVGARGCGDTGLEVQGERCRLRGGRWVLLWGVRGCPGGRRGCGVQVCGSAAGERRQVRQGCTRSRAEGRDSAAVGCGQQGEGR